MAKVYSAPENIKCEYDYRNFNYEREQAKEEAYIKELEQFCKKNTSSKSNLVGKTIQTGVADGYAVYMVYNTKPLELIHLEIGDAWNADRIWLRGLKLADVKQMVESAKLFGG